MQLESFDTKLLTQGEFGEVLLVQAPISAFPKDSLSSDLPKGATDLMAALKRLKENSSAETKKTFLGTGLKFIVQFSLCVNVYLNL